MNQLADFHPNSQEYCRHVEMRVEFTLLLASCFELQFNRRKTSRNGYKDLLQVELINRERVHVVE